MADHPFEKQFDPMFVIWSNEHRAWWGPGERGYTSDLAKAGRYPFHHAAEICYCAGPGSLSLPCSADGGIVPSEIMLPVEHALVSMLWHRQHYDKVRR
jgi:hypothetical protein